MKKTFFISFLIFISTFSFLYSDENDMRVVVASKLNMRTEPDINSKTIEMIEYGTTVKIIENTKKEIKIEGYNSRWVKIEHNGKTGYAADYYLAFTGKDYKLPPLYVELKLKSGEIKKLQNKPIDGESRKIYNLVIYNKEAGFYILDVSLTESDKCLLVNDSTGKETEVIGRPVFSPDNKSFMALSLDIAAHFNDSGIEIYTVKNGSPELSYRKIEDELSKENWGAKDGKWNSNTELEFTKVIADDNMKETEKKIKMKLENGKWKEKQKSGEPAMPETYIRPLATAADTFRCGFRGDTFVYFFK